MNLLLILPILIPLAAATSLLLTRRWLGVQRWLGVLSSGALLTVALLLLATVWRDGIQVVQIGNWPAPFGITLVADLFSAIMVVLANLTGFAVAIYSVWQMDTDRQKFGYFPLFHVLMMGVCGAFLTGDIFNLYVWFEVMLIASFVLLALGGERGQLEGAIKYVTLNLVSSAAFLAGIGILYAAMGTLNMADLSVKLSQSDDVRVSSSLAVLFLVAFGVKAAAFPFFFWLPASYHTPPAAVSAVFAGLLTKVGVYSLIRVFTLLFVGETQYTHLLLLWIAGLTMVTGVFGAMAQNEVRRILSFHIVSQIGYMLMGLALFTPLALAGSIFYIMHHIIVKTNLFLIGGVIERLQGTGRLATIGGLYRGYPALSILFLISALSLAGVPPLSGFFAKLILVRSGLESEQYGFVATMLGVGLMTLFSMTKIWNEAFWKPRPDVGIGGEVTALPLIMAEKATLYLPIIGLATLTVSIGLAAGPMFVLATSAANQLLDSEAYVRAVLGVGP